MSDFLQDAVDHAVSEIMAGPSKASLESLAPLAEANPEDLLPELFWQVEEAGKEVDISILEPTELVPDVKVAEGVFQSVLTHDTDLLRTTVKGDYSDLVVTLVSVIALLRVNANQDGKP